MALWDKVDTALGRPKFLDVGQVKKINITEGGVGYDTVPTVTITAAPGGGVDAVAEAVLTGGVVTAINITNPGAGYLEAPTIGFTGGTPETPAEAEAVIAGIAYNYEEIFFVDLEESQQEANKLKGITGPGWYRIQTFTDAQNNVRYKSEQLVAISVSATRAEAGDNDAENVFDYTILVTLQPADDEVVEGANATFTIAFDTEGADAAQDVIIQWQRLIADVWTDIADDLVYAGTNTVELVVTTDTIANFDGSQYRALLVDANDIAAQVTTDVATLTVVAA